MKSKRRLPKRRLNLAASSFSKDGAPHGRYDWHCVCPYHALTALSPPTWLSVGHERTALKLHANCTQNLHSKLHATLSCIMWL